MTKKERKSQQGQLHQDVVRGELGHCWVKKQEKTLKKTKKTLKENRTKEKKLDPRHKGK